MQGSPLCSSRVGQSGSLTQEKMEKKLKVMAARAESAPMYTVPSCVQDHWLVKKQKPMNHRKVQRPVGGSGMRGQGWSCCSWAVPGPEPGRLAQGPGQGRPFLMALSSSSSAWPAGTTPDGSDSLRQAPAATSRDKAAIVAATGGTAPRPGYLRNRGRPGPGTCGP